MQEKKLVIPPDYIKRPKAISKIPFGYKDSEILGLIKPVQSELKLLEEAVSKINNGFSIRRVAAWLQKKSGQHMSYSELISIINKNGYISRNSKIIKDSKVKIPVFKVTVKKSKG